MKLWIMLILAATLAGCSSAPTRKDFRLNEVYQLGHDGDVWECKHGECGKIR